MPLVEALAIAFDRRANHDFQRVVFLATHKIPTIKRVGIAPTTVLEIMQMVRNKMRIDTVVAKYSSKAFVKRFQWPPIPMRKI